MEKASMSDTAQGQSTPPRIRRAQTLALALLMVSGVVNYLDRGTLAVATPLIRAELGLSLGEMGLLLSAFLWSYALCQLPIGGMVDRIGPRRLLGAGLVIWSLAQMSGGLASSFGYFIVARVVLGIGEAPQFPSAARVVSNWFPIRSRGTPTGIYLAASPLGSALAPLCVSILLVSFKWRWAFIATGALGLAVAVVWFVLYRDPDKSKMTATERCYLDGDGQSAVEQSRKLTFAEWRGLFSHRTTWGMLIGFFGSVYLQLMYLTWLPGYLTIERHMSLIRTGFAASVPFLCGFAGSLLAGWFSDLITKRSGSPVSSRRNAVVVAMLGMVAFTIPAALVESNAIALACISVVIFLGNAATASSWALATAAAPPSQVASLAAIQNFGGFLGGALAPIVTGFIAQASSFVPALLTAAGVAFAGSMAYLLLVREPIPEREPASVVVPVLA